MAAEAAAYALAAVSQAPEPFRRMLSDLFGRRPGICTSTSWAVTQSGSPAMNCVVAVGTGLVLGSESSTQGLYFCQSTTTTTVTINAADATNARRDLIVARIRDNQYATGPTSAFSIEAIAGTPSGSPADPTVPANCLVLARVQVNASPDTTIVTGDITDLRTSYTGQTRASGLGGVVVCTAATRPTVNLHAGLVAWQTDTKSFVIYNGSTWDEMSSSPRVAAAGSVAMGTSFALVTGATLSIPAGSWLVKAKGAEVQTGTASQYDARIRNTTDSTDVDTITVFSTGAQRIPWSMVGSLVITATKTVRVEHMVATLNGTQTTDQCKIWAEPALQIL